VTAIVDPGAQLERTALAWRRTALTILVGGCIGARVLLSIDAPVASAFLAAMTAVLALLGVADATMTYRSLRARYTWGVPRPLTCGRSVALISSAACATALTGLLAVIGGTS
jgi:putative membrane protein